MSNHYTAKVAESLKLRGWIDEIQAKSLRNELDRHKSCLEVARGALREWIKFTSITPVFPLNNWFKMREELLSTTNDHLHQINEVLGGDSKPNLNEPHFNGMETQPGPNHPNPPWQA